MPSGLRSLTAGVVTIVVCSFAASPPPEVAITNGVATAKLYVPDPINGYYRGTRFDWAGVIYDLEYKNHHYFGKWFQRYEPTLHDAIMGPVDAFDPIGYDEAAVGETFVKIGVGVLEKSSDDAYNFAKPYKTVNGGKWKHKTIGKNAIRFQHYLADKNCSYRYQKTVTLTPGKPELVLSYTLENTGSNTIETNVFNHNFFVFDEQTTGPDYSVKFPFQPEGEWKGKAGAALLDGNTIRYTESLNRGESVMIVPLTGFGTSPSDYDLVVANAKTGTSVRIVGDQPIVRFVFWSAHSTVCPEPYTHVSVKPGGKVQWSIRYTFNAE